MALTKITNADMWNALRAKYPTFASHTSKVTKEFFTAQGFEALQQTDPQALNDFYGLSIRTYLNLINVSRAKDTLESNGFGEYYDDPMGGMLQRMAIDSLKPISPSYKNLQNYGSVDPYVIRKGTQKERFFKQNFDYQSMVTISDEFQRKQIFISEYGMSEFMGGIMAGLENGYIIQTFENKLEVLNIAINSTTYPLQPTQKAECTMSAEPTAEELNNFILLVKNLISATQQGPQTSAYNALKFATMQEKGRLKLLIRPGIMNSAAVRVLASAFNMEQLGLGIDVIEVPHFGGLQPYKEEAFTTLLHPVYSPLGEMIGYNEKANQSTVTVQTDAVFWKDPNENTYAILADKGLIFQAKQNPYTVEPIRNPRGLYTNYWASSPNNTIAVDPLYTMITINKTVA